ncbi:histidine kinase dimerization/phosphoacceptor domain -containing protein [Pedobacter xixiisoli]|nr:histidine kinase dimerization/phosphoacceptor domain -containing protein [Pedobacter xixiisoli]
MQKYTAKELLKNDSLFQPLNRFTYKGKTNAFWLKTRFKSTQQISVVIDFRHLTFADLYLIADTPGAVLMHRSAGALRAIEQITKGDSRYHFSFKADKNVSYILLIKSEHIKSYSPIFDFYLSERYQFLEKKFERELNELWPQGASALLFIYIFLRWVSTRYRPFIWLMLFVGAFNLYGIGLNRYMIDWFFASAPWMGLLIVQCCLYLGLFGLYMLLLDSWNIKERDVKLYRWGKTLIYGLPLMAAIIFLINYYFTNYQLTAKISTNFLLVLFVYSVVLLVKIWKKLDKHERLLAYGLICFLMTNLMSTAGIYGWGEDYYIVLPSISKAVSVCIAFLFLMGLNGRLKKFEDDHTHFLKELTLLQQHQNELLEQNVKERTKELSQRNAHIETLINELNHRVKNNLQVLYGLNSLRLAAKDNMDADGILKDNISRIKAMMLVNDNLQLGEGNQPLALKPFIENIIKHSAQVFDAENRVAFKVSINDGLQLDSSRGLPLGLIVTELIVNSYKHAFKNCVHPQITLKIELKENAWLMYYNDNGSGMPENVISSFGTDLIRDLTRQMQGELELTNVNGIFYTFIFSDNRLGIS